ncbi:MAG: formate dehydrogenase accessory sulfurtransferase FdhD [Xanthobacteraceae bacterium]|nr:formate dehydrogenase accessory sulfurtransferase FdhD [Xanthobacteraceae bacterium]
MWSPLAPIVRRSRVASRAGAMVMGERSVAEETDVAFTYNGSAHAVMMATPADLEDFAIGLSLTEGIIQRADEISDLDLIHCEDGVELRIWIPEERMRPYATRRRHLAGPTGCGLCGIESLSEAARSPPSVGDGLVLTAPEICAAMAALPGLQAINQETRAVHAAAFWRPDSGDIAIREDVGRHNALDKLIGSLARQGVRGSDGVVLLTSRVSVEMVQKAAVLGAAIVVAVSAPTALAIRVAQACRMTLIGIARHQDFEIFTHPYRIHEERLCRIAALD